MLGGREDSERHKRLGKEKMDGKDKEKRKDVMRIAGWKNEQGADMEDGR